MLLVTTVLFFLLYKYRCTKFIYGWMMVSSGVLLGFFGGDLFQSIVTVYNLPLDAITYYFLLFNFSVVGLLAVFWHAPLWMTQGYLIAVSVLMAISLTRIPEWTAWMILGVVSLWDLFAVLAPCGPLRLLLETAQQREEPIPGLLYSVDRDNVIRARNQPSTTKINADDEDNSSKNNSDNSKSKKSTNITDTTTNSVNNDETNHNINNTSNDNDNDNNNNTKDSNSTNDTTTSTNDTTTSKK